MESDVHSCHVLRTGRILQVNSSNGMGFIDCPELKVVWLWRILECWNVDACCARQFLATTFMCTGIRRGKCRGFMQNQSLPFLEVGAFPIGTEVNFAILLSKDWVAFNFCSDTIVEETWIHIFRIFVQTVKANYKLTHSERPFCRAKCKFNLLQSGKRKGHEAAGL